MNYSISEKFIVFLFKEKLGRQELEMAGNNRILPLQFKSRSNPNTNLTLKTNRNSNPVLMLTLNLLTLSSIGIHGIHILF